MLHSSRWSCALLLTAALAAQRTLTVGPGRQFAEIQDAVNAAAPGDRITVDAGHYNVASSVPLTVNKAVHISGTLPPSFFQFGTFINNGVKFVGIQSGQTASLMGAAINGGVLPGVKGLPVIEVIDCAGFVAIDRCSLLSGAARDAQGNLHYLADPVLLIARASVTVNNCSFFGGFGSPIVAATDAWFACSFDLGNFVLPGFYDLRASHSFIVSPQMTITGPIMPTLSFIRCHAELSSLRAFGGDSLSTIWSHGGDALSATDSEVRISRGVLKGGLGANNAAGTSGDGGNGIVHDRLLQISPSIILEGGAPGTGAIRGQPGRPVVGPAAQTRNIPSLAGLGSGSTATFAALCQPGTLVYWMLSTETESTVLPGIAGTLVIPMTLPFYVEGPHALFGTDPDRFFVTAPPAFRPWRIVAQVMALDIATLDASFSAPVVLGVW